MIKSSQPDISIVIKSHKDFRKSFFPEWRILEDLKMMDVSYEYSFDPILKDSPLHSRKIDNDQKIALQLLFPYKYVHDSDGIETTYHIYIFISNMYPYLFPIIMIDPLSSSDRMYRVQDGLEKTPLFHLYPYIYSFITHATHISELMSIHEYLGDCTNVNVKSYIQKIEHMYKYQIDIPTAYKLAVEAIHLKLE